LPGHGHNRPCRHRPARGRTRAEAALYGEVGGRDQRHAAGRNRLALDRPQAREGEREAKHDPTDRREPPDGQNRLACVQRAHVAVVMSHVMEGTPVV
jgi:hypothetical protein